MSEKQALSQKATKLQRLGLSFVEPAQQELQPSVEKIPRPVAISNWLKEVSVLLCDIETIPEKEHFPQIAQVIEETRNDIENLRDVISKLSDGTEPPTVTSTTLSIARKLRTISQKLEDKSLIAPEDLLLRQLETIREKCRKQGLEIVFEQLARRIIATKVTFTRGPLDREKLRKFLDLIGPNFQIERKDSARLTKSEKKVLEIIREVMTSN